MHDPRVGRFFAVDPLTAKYPWNSPYAFSENKLIQFVELEGLEAGAPGLSTMYSGLSNNEIVDISKAEAKFGNEVILDVTEMSDIEDATILATWILPGDATGVRGEKASGWDKGFALLGALVPLVSGSAVKKFFKGLGEGGSWILKQLEKHGGDVSAFRHVGEKLTKGQKRENLVADMVKGIVAKGENGKDLVARSQKTGLATTVDVIGENGDLITVGGAAKMKKIASFNSTMSTLKKIAKENGVKAKAYLADNSPKELIERAQKTLGKENVIIFKDVE